MIKLLIVDDSPLMRRLLGELFAAEGDFETAFAKDGLEALKALEASAPDVITLDVRMPGMDGLACLDRIMLQRPTPVVVTSAVTIAGAAEALRAIDLGAVDVVAKPAGAMSLRMEEFGPVLVEKVRAAAQARLSRTRRLRERVRARQGGLAAPKPTLTPVRVRRSSSSSPAPAGEGLVIVGSSTGGPQALDALLGPLPASFPWPIVIAQHMPGSFTGALARRLDSLTDLSVIEVREPAILEPGHAYVAAGDADMLLTRRRGDLVALSAPSAAAYRWHPSVDRLVESAREHVGAEQLVAVLMTGMGNDGARAMAALRRDGGRTLAQSEATSVVWGMPGELVREDGASAVCDLDDLAAALMAMVRS